MHSTDTSGPLILGASSRVGRMMRHLWQAGLLDFQGAPLWQYRQDTAEKQSLTWDILRESPPAIRPAGVICLAGGSHSDANVALAEAAIAVAQGAPVLLASTQSVYGRQSGAVCEATPPAPINAYGRDKLMMEQAVAGHENVTCLRIGNVIGADALLTAATQGPVTLDQFANGQGPRRMMIGPRTLAQAFIDLLAISQRPPVLNLAQPGMVAMADLLDAAGAQWHWQPAPETALPELEMDLRTVQKLIDLPAADPATLRAEVKAAGGVMLR